MAMFAFEGKADLASRHGRAPKLELHLLKPTTRYGVGVRTLGSMDQSPVWLLAGVQTRSRRDPRGAAFLGPAVGMCQCQFSSFLWWQVGCWLRCCSLRMQRWRKTIRL